MKNFFLILLVLCTGSVIGQTINIERIDPPFWWAGMKDTKLQLMLKGDSLTGSEVKVKGNTVTIAGTSSLESPNYLIIDLDLSNAVAGDLTFTLRQGKRKAKFTYALKVRKESRKSAINASDVLYLVMPDRFSNGDPSNDTVEGMLEAGNRDLLGGKHGGDIKGIIDHLDYIEDLGVTTIWLNPVYENNMPSYSYHGYSITDHYRVDPRYGTMSDYSEFVSLAHDKGLKVIKDMIFNHIGLNHFWMKDLPTNDWINQWEEFTQTNYTGAVVTDPYASNYDFDKMVKGWFVQSMPDLNQNNNLLMTYLIQQSIWWIEESDIDGIRMDTYPYPFKEPMAEWVAAIKNEYPSFYIVGETWLHAPSYEGYWQKRGGFVNKDGYESNLESVSDFPLYYAIQNAFVKNEGLYKLYEVLAQDFVYPSPNDNKIFIDNHDVDRFFGTVKQDLNKFKMAMTFLLTTRGIPQVFYGTEIIMSGMGDHGNLRQDFPGGWQGDSRNAFEEGGRTELENEAFTFTQDLLKWRKSKSELFKNGKLIHFIPEKEVYVYSRYTDGDRFIVVINNNDEAKQIDLTKRYSELGHTKTISVQPKSAVIID